MPSSLYQRLLATVTPYIGEEKATGAVSRQLKHCNGSPETFSGADLQKITLQLIGATTLYVRDPAAKQELTDKIKALA